ncbi:hypothetical protein NDU88_004209 [Pleurodeles waltl]|uniref:Uncharacterized protein n=1 Tax=Pleurodeles waltl TaxID=8319 RepID=A0AAV7T7D3_PLEWA|nr:hypothetical protein NDU88_004209 [Pleurodeles waltl]
MGSSRALAGALLNTWVLRGSQQDLLDNNEEGVLEEGKIVEVATSALFVPKKAAGGGRTVNFRRSIGVFQEFQKPVQHDLGGFKNAWRWEDQSPLVRRDKEKVVWGNLYICRQAQGGQGGGGGKQSSKKATK